MLLSDVLMVSMSAMGFTPSEPRLLKLTLPREMKKCEQVSKEAALLTAADT